MVAIFGMNQLQAVPPYQLFGLIPEDLGGRRTSIQYCALRVDQRDRIGTVFDERAKNL
jgi:hypothetical protein